MRTPLILLASLFLLAGCFMPASAANRAAQRDRERVRAEAAAEWRRVDAHFASQGWRPAGEPVQGSLQERYDESDDIRVTLPAAGQYAMAAICGSNCRDMDLVVWNSARRRVAADVEPDARPVVLFEGAAGERFTVTVTIPDCVRPPRHPQLNQDPLWACIYFTRLYTR